jgi:hypothetical protein
VTMQQFPIEALVVDIITNESHPEYSSDGYNFGLAKIRFLEETAGLSDDRLSIAHPMDHNMLELPLIGEVVLVMSVFGKFYYTKKISLTKNINHSVMVGQNEFQKSKLERNTINQDPNIPSQVEFTKTVDETFLVNNNLLQLKHFPGDFIIQGRFGNSIRFGSSLMEKDNKTCEPNLLLRVGQPKYTKKTAESDFGLTLEDINNDGASLWLTTNQVVPINYATSNGKSFLRSGNPQLPTTGSQVVINADSVTINSKTSSLYLFSAIDIRLNSLSDISLDTDSSIYLNADNDVNIQSGNYTKVFSNKDIEILTSTIFSLHAEDMAALQGKNSLTLTGKKVYIGEFGNQDEPMVLGNKLVTFLTALIDAILTGPLGSSPTGPVFISGPASPLNSLKVQLSKGIFNSRDNFVANTNVLQ